MRRIAGPRVALVAGLLAVASVLVGTEPAPAVTPLVTLVPVADVALGSIVTDRADHAYIVAAGRIEVLRLSTRTLEAPIPVSGGPVALDLSPDGTILYVANGASMDVVAIDLPTRTEVLRVALPLAPIGLAVAANGTALVSGYDPDAHETRIRQIDLVTGALRDRGPIGPGGPLGLHASRFEASRDRGHIVLFGGATAMYSAATDTFAEPKTFGQVGIRTAGVDATGSKVALNPGTLVADGRIQVTATIPATASGGTNQAIALDAAGSRAYRVNDAEVDVLDLVVNRVTATIALPDVVDYWTDIAVSGDGTALVVLTRHGIVVAPVGTAVPVPPCTPTSPAPGVVGVCGRLADVVVDAAGHAYASNPALNQVEVVSLATGALQAPIPVGSRPLGLDLSPDGRTLYVADSGAYEVSVVDTASRRELRRIPIPPHPGPDRDRPFTIAVANNGTALLTTGFNEEVGGARILQLDLATETVRLRPDFDEAFRNTGPPSVARSGADHALVTGVAERDQFTGLVALYTSTTDTFSRWDAVPGRRPYLAAVGNARTKMLFLQGSSVFDADMVLRATIPGDGRAVAVDPAGSRGYRVRDDSVEVLDLVSELPTSSIGLPDWIGGARGTIAVTPDGAKVVVLTERGISIAAVASARPLPACVPPSAPAGVVAVCGGPRALTDVAFGGSDLVYATNSARNQVEVLSLATGALQAPIAVGSQPRSLDLSADGKTLYVANGGADDISVVDLGLRREVHRITVPVSQSQERPRSIAVAADGTALVTTTSPPDAPLTGRLLKVQPATGTVTQLLAGGSSREVSASGDRSRIAYVDANRGVYLYTVATGVLSAPAGPLLISAVALDNAGSKVLTGPGTYILDGTPTYLSQLPGEGSGVALNRSGTVGYRVHDAVVETLDLVQGRVGEAVRLPEAGDAISLSPDGSALAVATVNGLAVVSAVLPGSTSPSAVWRQPTTRALDAIGTWVVPANIPSAGAGQLAPKYLYAHYFSFTQSASALGVAGLVVDGGVRLAAFGIVDGAGTSHSVGIPFEWQAGRAYYLFVAQLGPSSYGAWVYDYTAAAWTFVGQVAVPVPLGKISPTSLTTALWYGPQGANCLSYPRADVYFYPPVGYAGGTTAQATMGVAGPTAGGACPDRGTTELAPWAHLHRGADAA